MHQIVQLIATNGEVFLSICGALTREESQTDRRQCDVLGTVRVGWECLWGEEGAEITFKTILHSTPQSPGAYFNPFNTILYFP